MEWQTVAFALGGVAVSLGGWIGAQVTSSLARVSGSLADVAKLVHGHGIRLDLLERRDHDRD